MKQIIGGKTYNTSTATELAYWDQMGPKGWVDNTETLYRTKNGNYFLKFGYLEVGNHEYSLRPMTREEAFEWAQSRGQEDLIDLEFFDLTEEA